MTQAQAAEAIGISANTLSSYENGKSYPDVPMLQKMEKVYGVRYDQLIFRPRSAVVIVRISGRAKNKRKNT